VAEDWRRLHNEELHNLYASPNIIRVMESRSIRLVRQVVRMWRWEIYTKYWLENLKRRDHLEDLGVRGRIILERILGNSFGNCGLYVSCSG